MILPTLPTEVLVRILKHVPLYNLEYFHENLPNGVLRYAIESYLFEKITLSRSYGEDLHCVSVKELYKLAKGELKATVKVLEFGMLGDECDQDAFLTFCSMYSDFITSIPEIMFWGRADYFQRYASIVPTDNVVNWNVYGMIHSQPIPRSVKDVYVEFKERDEPVLKWPTTIKKLKIKDCEQCEIIELPAGLEELESMSPELSWTTFPDGLKKLTIYTVDIDIRQLFFPELLTELNIEYIELLNDMLQTFTWPSNLEHLRIDIPFFDSLATFQFPPNLKVFDLQFGHIRTLEGARFPSLLKELYVGRNPISNLAGVEFPDLKVLDLHATHLYNLEGAKLPSLLEVLNLNFTDAEKLDDLSFPNLRVFTYTSNVVRSMSKVALPSILEELDLTNQKVRDWDRTKFPDGLKVLKLDTDDPKSLNLPPSLETLHITFPKGTTASYAELKLPTTLRLLQLVNGISERFDWNLPNLSDLTVLHLKGPISISDLVEVLHLEAKNINVFEDLGIPGRVEDITLSFPARSYPASVKKLLVLNFDNTKNLALPPRLRSLSVPLGKFRENERRTRIKLPPTLLDLTTNIKNTFERTVDDAEI